MHCLATTGAERCAGDGLSQSGQGWRCVYDEGKLNVQHIQIRDFSFNFFL